MSSTSAYQSNTQEGLVVKSAGADLSAKGGFLAKLDSNAQAVLAGAGEQAIFIVDDEGASGANVTLLPLSPTRNSRVYAAGSISAAGEVQSDSAGKIVAASSGSWVIGIAEEAIVTGQLGLIRPVGPYIKA